MGPMDDLKRTSCLPSVYLITNVYLVYFQKISQSQRSFPSAALTPVQSLRCLSSGLASSLQSGFCIEATVIPSGE